MRRFPTYWQRIRHQKAKIKDRAAWRHEQWFTEIDHLIHAYEIAYFDLHNQPVIVSYRKGWYYTCGQRYRRNWIEKQTAMMMAAVHERELNAPVEVEG